MIKKIAIVRKVKGKYKLYSKHKGKDGKRRLLGTYNTLKEVKDRERQIQYFKSHSDDGMADDKETRMLKDLSGIAAYLESAGYVDKADKIYAVMNAIDGSLGDE